MALSASDCCQRKKKRKIRRRRQQPPSQKARSTNRVPRTTWYQSFAKISLPHLVGCRVQPLQSVRANLPAMHKDKTAKRQAFTSGPLPRRNVPESNKSTCAPNITCRQNTTQITKWSLDSAAAALESNTETEKKYKPLRMYDCRGRVMDSTVRAEPQAFKA